MDDLDFYKTMKKEYEQHRALLDTLEIYEEAFILSALQTMAKNIEYIRYRIYPEFISECEEDIICKLPNKENSKGIVLLTEESSTEVKKAYRDLVYNLSAVLIQRDQKQDDFIIPTDATFKIHAMYEANIKKVPKWLQKK